MFTFLVICLTLFNNVSPSSQYGTNRKTIYGWIRGKVSSRVPGLKVEEYLGVPYALPPIGHFRFKRPKEPVRWYPIVLNTTKLPPACPTVNLDYIQFHKPGFKNLNEDCLYMNIYKPLSQRRKLPVLFFIHGGSNADGMGAMFDGDILAAHGQIIVVTFNYRVSVLGFYANESLGIKGNNGLMDQVLAMKWVQRNIRYFGGDPFRVTIHGHSSGAADVGAHLISPLTKGLFRNAIIHSGSPLAYWFMSKCVRSGNTLVIPKECRRGTSLVTSEARKAKIRKLVEGSSTTDFFSPYFPRQITGNSSLQSYQTRTLKRMDPVFESVIDGDFITDSPDKLFTCGQFHAHSVLILMARDEGLQAYPPSIKRYYDYKTIDRFIAENKDLFPERKHFEEDIMRVNKEWIKNNISTFPHYLHMHADLGFFAPMIKLADRISEELKKVFILSFQYISENKPGPDWTGVQHGWDLFYTFGVPTIGHSNIAYTPRDASVSKDTMKLISEYVRKGYTSTERLKLEIYRPACKSYNKLDYVNGKTIVTNELNFRAPRIDFWYKYLYAYENYKCDRYNKYQG
ncbi:cholinesterase 1-like isoform X2 [Mytilus californianus]|uniref:cholinesterase 1-like isoform X2 n=1 Tax=Mytilus californianus TaxID=6549 RepID=UPI0022469AAB|nr:cholinesterase 1-like isoform X2 [Mytilus californianus]